jgi:integrase
LAFVPVCALGERDENVGDRGCGQLVTLPSRFKPSLRDPVRHNDRERGSSADERGQYVGRHRLGFSHAAQGNGAYAAALPPHSKCSQPRISISELRRTCASVLVALGKDPRYVMAQLGHTDPTVTLGIYAQAMTSSDDDRERLRLLVEGADLAVEGKQRDNDVATTESIPVAITDRAE